MIDASKYNPEAYGINMRDAKEVTGKNEIRTFCPHCHANRKTEHRKERELWVSLDTGNCKCHNCGAEWRMDTVEYTERMAEMECRASGTQRAAGDVRKASQGHKTAGQTAKFALPPTPDSFNPPTDARLVSYITEVRRLPMDVIRGMKVTQASVMMPQVKAERLCIVFNYLHNGVLVNRKYRDSEKHFMMDKGAELIPYNIDSALGSDHVIVTEGEFDTLSLVAAGFSSVVSMPSGANSNTSWLDRFYDDYFADKKRVYIATDMDAPGMKAAEELIRRFGPEVCYRVTFSDGCKDANDELVKHGVEGLRKSVEEAQPVPLKDIKTMDDFGDMLDLLYQEGPKPGACTGWENLDRVVKFQTGQLALVTGRTNDGKSEWVDELVLRLALSQNWKIAYWTPENTLLDHNRKLIEKLTGRTFVRRGTSQGVQPGQYHLCKQWIGENVTWIDLPFDKLNLDTILERSRSLVRKFGIRLLVLDPFNFIEKENNSQRSENAWDSHVVGAIRSFAIENDVMVVLVAHPRKVEMQIDGRRRRITIEDISGTADFGNKADYCFCVDRDDDHKVVTISVDKVRNKLLGSRGQAFFVYQKASGRYVPCDIDDKRNPVNTDFAKYGGMWIDVPELF